MSQGNKGIQHGRGNYKPLLQSVLTGEAFAGKSATQQ